MLWEGVGTQQEEGVLEHTFFLEETSITLLSGGPLSSGKASVGEASRGWAESSTWLLSGLGMNRGADV